MTLPAQLTGRLVSSAADAYHEYFHDTNVILAHLWQGPTPADQAPNSNIVLLPVGTALSDQLVEDTLSQSSVPGWGAGESWSHAFGFQAALDSFDVPVAGDIAWGTDSVMLHVTAKGPVVPMGAVELAGNEDLTSGVSLRVDNANQLIAFVVQSSVVNALTIPGWAPDIWFDLCLIVDRENGVARLGTYDDEVTMPIGPDTLQSTRAFSLGSGRVTAKLGQVMRAGIAFGPQLAGVSARDQCILGANRIWAEPVRTHVTSDAR